MRLAKIKTPPPCGFSRITPVADTFFICLPPWGQNIRANSEKFLPWQVKSPAVIETLDSSYSFETKVTYTLEKVTRAFQELPAGAGKNGPKGGGGEGKKKSMGLPLALGEQKSFPRNIKQKPVSEQVASP